MDSFRQGVVLGAVAGVVVCAIVVALAHFVLGLTFEGDRATIPESVVGKRLDQANRMLQARGFDNIETPGAGYFYGVPSEVADVVPGPGNEVETDTTITLQIQKRSK